MYQQLIKIAVFTGPDLIAFLYFLRKIYEIERMIMVWYGTS